MRIASHILFCKIPQFSYVCCLANDRYDEKIKDALAQFGQDVGNGGSGTGSGGAGSSSPNNGSSGAGTDGHGLGSGQECFQDRFVTGSIGDQWVRIHGAVDGEEREVLKGHHGPVHCIEYSPDGEMYASGSG